MSLVFLLFHPAREITLCLKPVSPKRPSTPERAGHASDFGIPSRMAGVPRAPERPLQTRHRNLGLWGGRHCGDDATDRFPGAAGTPLRRLQGSGRGGPVGTRAAEKRGGVGGHGTHEQTKAPEGTLQPAETLCGASREAERERRDFTGPQTLGKKGCNSPGKSQEQPGKAQYWHPSGSLPEGEVRGERELGRGQGGPEAA